MYSTTLLLVALAIASVNACSRRRPPPTPPPTPKPTPGPTAPPTPAPVPTVLLTQRVQDQRVGFNKCYRKCDGNYIPMDAQGNKLDIDYQPFCKSTPPPSTGALAVSFDPYQVQEEDNGGGVPAGSGPPPGSSEDQRGNPCGAESKCVYECKFEVIVEVALTTISRESGCGCALHMRMVKHREAPQLNNQILKHHVADTIDITDFELIVWDYKANRQVESIPEFKLKRSLATVERLQSQIKTGNSEDFTAAMMGFAGQVTSFPKLPASLDLNQKKNHNNVPALKFTVIQTYSDIKNWKAPKKPNMGVFPNAYQTQCVPFWPHAPFCYNSKKRRANEGCDGKTPELYQKLFMVNSQEGVVAGTVGKEYTTRLIRSFYTNDECSSINGVFSFDAHFKQSLKASTPDTELPLGVWSWERQWNDGADGQKWQAQYVLGVPSMISGMKQSFDRGYVTISWEFPTGHKVGTDTVDKTHVLPKGICQKFDPVNAPVPQTVYKDEGLFYLPEDGIKCAPFDDFLSEPNCGTESAPDRSLMAFLNPGEILNFNRRASSTIVFGKQTKSCNLTPFGDQVVFDAFRFSPVQNRRPLVTPLADKKRGAHDDLPELGLVYDEELEGYVHFLHPRSHVALAGEHKRALKDELESQVATPPTEEVADYRVATGSVAIDGQDSANAGDHPLELFPETFSAPVNIDPQADADKIVPATVTTGTDVPTCFAGSIGCTCRNTAGLQCDIGLKCDDSMKCLPESCLPGQPGCVCKGETCDGENTECVKEEGKPTGYCRTKTVCTAGDAGCSCDANNQCNGKAGCAEGACLLDDNCEAGEAGCSCTNELTCKDSAMECDEMTALCLAPRCTPGTPGCRCNDDGSCNNGFDCTNAGICALYECPKGHPGCECTEAGTCTKPGFNCEAFTTTGDSRCVADPHPECFPQNDRCLAMCGSGNVAVCPPCTNGEILCRVDPDKRTVCEIDPFSPQCTTTAAATTIMSLAAALVAVVALF